MTLIQFNKGRPLFFFQGFCGLKSEMLLHVHGSWSRSFRRFWRHPPQQRLLAGERRHARGHSKRGGVSCCEALQADDHVAAAFGDDLPNVLFLGTEEKSKQV